MSVARIGNGLYVRAGRPRPTSGIRDLFPLPHAIDKCEFDRKQGLTRYHCFCGWRSAWYAVDADALAAIARHLEDRR